MRGSEKEAKHVLPLEKSPLEIELNSDLKQEIMMLLSSSSFPSDTCEHRQQNNNYLSCKLKDTFAPMITKMMKGKSKKSKGSSLGGCCVRRSAQAGIRDGAEGPRKTSIIPR